MHIHISLPRRLRSGMRSIARRIESGPTRGRERPGANVKEGEIERKISSERLRGKGKGPEEKRRGETRKPDSLEVMGLYARTFVPLQAYEWEPRGFVDPLPAGPISRPSRPPKKTLLNKCHGISISKDQKRAVVSLFSKKRKEPKGSGLGHDTVLFYHFGGRGHHQKSSPNPYNQ
ncbi:hypothetical protein ALC57_12246 [Trachymyrmex cornetzi]|uniref:Uncharacterized protein n=1 Tax=Trachymyrmex cornetzi TaxID=471704 RepID=A0A151J1A4_9HYME|nr:hypothetical protein ALC57_12246 [Trachymyrmex cornetzi]